LSPASFCSCARPPTSIVGIVSVLAVAPTMAWVLAKDFGTTVAEHAVGGTTLAARTEDG
jgi:hypothetical protein